MHGEFKGKRYEDKGEIHAAESEKRLAFSHWSELSGAPDTKKNYHDVSFDLSPAPEGTKVLLTQSNLAEA
jgi:hypothetical protein